MTTASTPLSTKTELAQLVVDVCGVPLDSRAVAALLESRGLREADAASYGSRSLFELADEVFAEARRLAGSAAVTVNYPKEMKRPLFARFISNYLRGLLSSLPLAGQILVFLALGLSLWAWTGFSERLATVITLGALASYLVTGGVIQAMSWRGAAYVGEGQHHLAHEYIGRMLRVGLLAAAGLGAVWFTANLIIPVFEADAMGIALLYFSLLTLLWLNLAALYVLEQRLAALFIMLGGLALVLLVFAVYQASVIPAHAVGLIATVAGMYFWGRRVMADRESGVPESARLARLPRDSILIFTAAPYFIYGTLYFVFVFIDRINAWSAAKDPLPYLIWFRPPYEAGMDLALIPLILTAPVLEHTLREFSLRMIPLQELTASANFSSINRKFREFYVRQLALGAAIGAAALVFAESVVFGMRLAGIGIEFVANSTVLFVFHVGALSYLLLVWGLFNGMVAQAVTQLGPMIRALFISFAVNLIVGYVLSRVLSYEYAVLGLLAGALTFGVFSTRLVLKLFDSLDYYYFATA